MQYLAKVNQRGKHENGLTQLISYLNDVTNVNLYFPPSKLSNKS
jgi:hypothetical protein